MARAVHWSLPGADKGARRPTGHSRGARAPGLCRPQCLCVSISVCLWRAPLPAGLPQGPPPTGHRPTLLGPAGRSARLPQTAAPQRYRSRARARARRPHPDPSNAGPRPPARRLPPRQLGRPTGRRPPPPRAHLRASPPSLPSSPLLSSPSLPRHPRARTPGPSNGARAPAPLPSTGTPRARASDGPSPTHTHRPRPAHNRACKRSRVRKSFRGEAHFRWQTARLPRGHVPRPTGHRPSSPGGGGPLLPVRARARPSRTANWRGPMEGGESEGTGRRRSPRVSGERCLAPLQAPGAAGPVGGRCLPTNLAKDRADAQRLVATRLLDRLHDPLGHFSRLQRIHPRAR
jgi:hypothetical protein